VDWPHFEHLIFFPAKSSLTRYCLPQCWQENAIAMAVSCLKTLKGKPPFTLGERHALRKYEIPVGRVSASAGIHGKRDFFGWTGGPLPHIFLGISKDSQERGQCVRLQSML
jgi:hypothetical protein